MRTGGYDIRVCVLAAGSNVSVCPIIGGIIGAVYNVYQSFSDIATYPPPSIVNFNMEQDEESPNAMKAIQVQQAVALASEFMKIINNGDYLDSLPVIYPNPFGENSDYSSFYGGLALFIGLNVYSNWDVIIHEYGHYVADVLTSFAFLISNDHNFNTNYWDSNTEDKEFSTKLAWQEGWADYFSLYTQYYMINEEQYIGEIVNGNGTLGDLLWSGYSIETGRKNGDNFIPNGEANEGAVQCVLWDITDDYDLNEPFDTLNCDFRTICDYIYIGDCLTLSEFVSYFNAYLSDSEEYALGDILSEYNVSPELTGPADGAVFSAISSPPTFTWNPGGCINHPNNVFKLTIYIMESGVVTEIFDSAYLTSTSYTLSSTDWNNIFNNYGDCTLYWAVKGYQTTDDDTGPYLSNSSSIIPLPTPELIAAIPLDEDTNLILWNEVPTATGYTIYYSNSQNGVYAPISYTYQPYAPNSTVMSYTDTGFTLGYSHYYKVKATIGTSSSEFSNAMAVVPNCDFTYTQNQNDTLTITGYSGTSPSVIIPTQINGYTVTAIGDEAFSYSTITSIIIPNTVTSIGNQAFTYTIGLSNINIPNSVTSIGAYAFACSGISGVSLSNSLTDINYGLFFSTNLESIVIPNSITSIRSHAFNSCYYLSTVTLSNNLTSIGAYAFNYTNINNISFPDSIENIDMYAFGYCENLSSVNINSSSDDFIIGDYAFVGCSSLSSVTIDTCESIGMYAFSGNNGLLQVELTNVEDTGCQAFSNCDSLEEVTVSNVGTIGDYSFYDCDSLQEIDISNTEIIDTYAFYGCDDLISADIDALEIGEYAFCDCQSLYDLDLDGIETIGDGAFNGCISLTEVDIPSGVTYLGESAFVNCTGLTRVVIPGSVSEISYAAFAGCSSLYDVTLGYGIESIMEYAFASCTALTQLTIPVSVTYIDPTAFQGSGLE
ncbi:MAG TPA: leucine-rich repeat domain-containing protein [Oscillospiraceae bacterium]|nr:leucine-rich repeat domain-containing protein [Oscillospiraceae bacterium]HPK34227.1 leucine-rich repeat domain-containing protein [Oscillospiraceae bacterium]HPR74870.1 leucine-rich repeat domain-containing protein [Oscillospiraceae bacterium]